MKRVLVTGATGFVGRHVIAPLRARGYEVHAVSSRAGVSAIGDALWHQANLLDAASMVALVHRVRASHLLHLAWHTEPGTFWDSPENERWLAASASLLASFAQAGGRRAVVAGTCAEYDWHAGGVCREGVTPLRPRTAYGKAKAALHASLEERYGDLGVPALAWGRIFFLYGPGEYPSRLVPSIATALLEGRPARCSHGRQIRDFLHSADVAGAFAALLDAEDVVGAVNIASGQPVTIAEVVGMIADASGRPELVELGALPVRADEPETLIADIGRLRDEVGFVPAWTLAAGLAATVDWWRQGRGAGPRGRVAQAT